jgi:4-aminobutyrate aminotransferase
MYGNVIRLSPPMNITRSDVDQFIGLLDKSLAACGAVAAGSAR